ncbi:MAG: oligosaccharide flippase family protein [Polyangiales bacterium]
MAVTDPNVARLDSARVSVRTAGPSKILRNAASILLGDAFGEAITGYAIALSAVSLGPRLFGELSEAQAFADPFGALAAFGLTPVAVTLGARRGASDGTLRGTVDALRVGFATLAALIVMVFAILTGRGNFLPIITIIAIGEIVYAWSSAQMLPFQIEQTMERAVALPFVASLVRIATAYMAVWWLCSPVGFQLSGLAGGVATALLFTWAARRHYPTTLQFDPKLARTILATAWPAAVEGVLVMLYLRGAYLALHSADALVRGEFAAADRLIRPLLGIAAALSVSALPTIAALESDPAALRAMFKSSVVRTLQLVGLAVAIAWPLSGWLLSLGGGGWAGAIWPFRILLLGLPFIFLNQLARTYVIGLARYRAVLAVAAVNLALFGLFAVVLVKRYGASGAAIATVATEVLSTLMLSAITLNFLRKKRV